MAVEALRVKPACELASRHPKPCASLKKRRGNLARLPLLVGPRKKKKTVVTYYQLSPQNLQVRSFDFRAQGFSTPLARWRSRYHLSSVNLVLTHPTIHATTRLRVLLLPTRLSATVSPASRVPPPPKGHQIGARKRRCVSTGRLNRRGSQLAATIEDVSSPTPTGKTLLHSYPKIRLRREKVRG